MDLTGGLEGPAIGSLGRVWPRFQESGESLISFEGENWLRGLDSNQDSQIQSLESYQLDDPGADDSSVAEACDGSQARAIMHAWMLSVKLIRRLLTGERCPSGLRSTLGKRV